MDLFYITGQNSGTSPAADMRLALSVFPSWFPYLRMHGRCTPVASCMRCCAPLELQWRGTTPTASTQPCTPAIRLQRSTGSDWPIRSTFRSSTKYPVNDASCRIPTPGIKRARHRLHPYLVINYYTLFRGRVPSGRPTRGPPLIMFHPFDFDTEHPAPSACTIICNTRFSNQRFHNFFLGFGAMTSISRVTTFLFLLSYGTFGSCLDGFIHVYN
jgi:hypothetical protein